MEKFEGINGRIQLIKELENKYIEKSAKKVTLVYAENGQGKSFIINSLVTDLKENESDLRIYCK